jgi:hypothetical protein
VSSAQGVERALRALRLPLATRRFGGRGRWARAGELLRRSLVVHCLWPLPPRYPPGCSCPMGAFDVCVVHAWAAPPRMTPKARRIRKIRMRSISTRWRALRASSCRFLDGDFCFAVRPPCCCCCSQLGLFCCLPCCSFQTTPYSATEGSSNSAASETAWRTFRRAALLKPWARPSLSAATGKRDAPRGGCCHILAKIFF